MVTPAPVDEPHAVGALIWREGCHSLVKSGSLEVPAGVTAGIDFGEFHLRVPEHLADGHFLAARDVDDMNIQFSELAGAKRPPSCARRPPENRESELPAACPTRM